MKRLGVFASSVIMAATLAALAGDATRVSVV